MDGPGVWPLGGLALALTAGFALHSRERAAVVVGLLVVTLLLTALGLALVFLYWGAAKGCWS